MPKVIDLQNEYFQWMVELISDNVPKINTSQYGKLLSYLHNVGFFIAIGMDSNRAEDGIDLRYRFGYEKSHDQAAIAVCLDDGVCSVLEMLVALSLRCEESIMSNSDIGNRLGQWFWGMIDNLGLLTMTDSNFDKEYINSVMDKFLNRQYSPDGKGGLFTIPNCKVDLRDVEIWYQMSWYLNRVIDLE